MKNNIPTLRDILIAFVINLISNGVFVLFQVVSGSGALELQIPIWILILFVGTVLTVTYFIILRVKVDPFLELIDDLRVCIEDFERFFKYPCRAIMPNPFSEEPEFWKHYEKGFSHVLYSWYSSLKRRFEKSRKGMDEDILVAFSNDFHDIVRYYLSFAESFREFVKKHPTPKHIRKQFNTNYVEEFNTLFRPNLVNYLRKLQKITNKKIVESDIKLATKLEGWEYLVK